MQRWSPIDLFRGFVNADSGSSFFFVLAVLGRCLAKRAADSASGLSKTHICVVGGGLVRHCLSAVLSTTKHAMSPWTIETLRLKMAFSDGALEGAPVHKDAIRAAKTGAGAREALPCAVGGAFSAAGGAFFGKQTQQILNGLVPLLNMGFWGS